MNWSKVFLILNREIRDQLRDRRTLFMIFVLPILLYPFMGMSMFQLMQFTQEHPTRVLVLGAEELPPAIARSDLGVATGVVGATVRDALVSIPPLVEIVDDLPSELAIESHVSDDAAWRFNPRWFEDGDQVDLLHVELLPAPVDRNLGVATGATLSPWLLSQADDRQAQARAWLRDGTFQSVVILPPGFLPRLEDFHNQLIAGQPYQGTSQIPDIQVWHNTAKKKSEITRGRILQVVRRWREAIIETNLEAAGISPQSTRPFDIEHGEEHDVADRRNRYAAMWSMVFPFMLLIWSLTGAFYPAVDLCAGEKERGTLETLLTSPAERSEIVWGKLLTIMAFSIGTVVLNLLALAATGVFVLSRIPNFGPPPTLAFLWLFLAMVPVAALFSALCLALAAFARSSKEGQYYLMPLFLITLPLVALPLSPSFELTLGNSLIPVTGVVLLLRSAIEGDYFEAFRYLGPVVMVTLACCWLAMRWAVDQFNKESVLFRESERFELGAWLRHLRRDRNWTPTVAAALMCGILILIIKFFLGLAINPTRVEPFAQILVPQLVAILFPALLMTIIFTRSPRETLLLKKPRLWAIPAAVLLALAWNPVAQMLGAAVNDLYPLPSAVKQAVQELLNGTAPSFWMQLVLFALVPAVCEELAFRGFILSGLRHLGRKKLAILITSLFFGLTHAVAQQQIMAAITGMLLGYLAVQTGSVLPSMLFHFVHNGLVVGLSRLTPAEVSQNPILRFLFEVQQQGGEASIGIRWVTVALGAILSLGLLYWFHKLPHAQTQEEELQAAIKHQTKAPSLS